MKVALEKSDFQFEDIRFSRNVDIENELIELWHHEDGLMDTEIAKERAKEVIFVARSPEGKLVGVASIEKAVDPTLGENFYYYRSYVHPDQRRVKLMINLFRSTVNQLEEEFIQGTNQECLGMIIISENEELKAATQLAVMTVYNCIFFGWNAHNSTMHVKYFDGAKI